MQQRCIGCQAQRGFASTRVTLSLLHPRMISVPGAAQMRRENHAKTIWAVKSVANQKYVAQRIRQDIEHELVASPWCVTVSAGKYGPGVESR